MKIKKKLAALVLCSSIVLTSTVNVSFANEDNKFSESSNLLEIKEWKESKYSNESFITKEMKSTEGQSISEAKMKFGENIIMHNNGLPIKTNIFEEKHGNELFAITVNNTNGIEQKTYYFSQNIDNIEMDKLLDNINDQEDINNDTIKTQFKDSKSTRLSDIKHYKWDFYATGKDGVKRQQGSLATSVGFNRKSSNTTVNGVKGSVWDVDSFSQMLSRSNGFIDNHVTRLDVNYTNQQLYSWGPYDTGETTAKVSLTGLITPESWEFPLNGFKVNDLSNKGSKYGRWQYKSHLLSGTTKMNTKPGMRVTNTKGNFGLKLSQTAKIATPYAISDHSTGVISIFTPDR